MAETGSPRRIGLLGGSFDPVHQAHRQLGDVALSQLALDELRWVVTGQPWQKQGRRIAAPEHRAAMVELAIADEPRHRLERCELDRVGPSYMLDTVRTLQAAEPQSTEWFLVIGQDQYTNFHTWHGWRELLACVTLAVAARPGQADSPHESLAATPHRLRRLEMPESAVSATEIRRRLTAGSSAASLAPSMLAPAVAEYIDRRRLYHPVPAPT